MHEIVSNKEIQDRIFTLRGVQVMLDSDLAELYHVTTGRVNEQVKRNIKRFPPEFMFQLTRDEWQNLKSQNAISSWGGRRKLPYVFTEQGVSMLSAVLKSDVAIEVSIRIIKAFVNMRRFLNNHATIFQRLDKIELKQLKTDEKIDRIFKAIEGKSPQPEKGIFFDGQIFDAHVFVSRVIKEAKKEIVLIDNYIDESVLVLFTKRAHKVRVKIFTKIITPHLELDVKKYNRQYPSIEIKSITHVHDRFLIIDQKELYHIGASLKDLGKKWFAFSKMDDLLPEILERLKT